MLTTTAAEHGAPALLAADRKVAEILARAAQLQAGDVEVVNAPAGAGKTGLVTRLIPKHVKEKRRVAVITQTNEQADDLSRRLASEQPKLSITRLISAQHTCPPFPGNVVVEAQARNLSTEPIVIATADKWAFSADSLGQATFDIGIVDEAYQMAGGKLLYVADLFGAMQMVGDPGQLSPFSQVETDRWAGLATNPTKNAVETVCYYRNVLKDTLPVTRRLPAVAAGLVQRAFYPDLSFSAATAVGERRLQVDPRRRPTSADRAVDMALSAGWAYVELPDRSVQRNDHELAAAAVAVAKSLLERNPTREEDEHHGLPRTLEPSRIAIGASHRDQVASVGAALRSAGLTGVAVDTANRLQGREFDVVIAWHPLSGQVEAGAFHLDVGRMCVLTTRHRHACIVLGRAGITDLMEMSVPIGEGLLGEPTDRSISGWEAHLLLLDELAATRVAW